MSFSSPCAALAFAQVQAGKAQELAAAGEVGERPCFPEDAAEMDGGDDALLRGGKRRIGLAQVLVERGDGLPGFLPAAGVEGQVIEELAQATSLSWKPPEGSQTSSNGGSPAVSTRSLREASASSRQSLRLASTRSSSSEPRRP